MAHAWGDPRAYAVSFGPLCAQTVADVVTACGVPEAHPFLDVGCGTGALATSARTAGWTVAGVDADAAMVRVTWAAPVGVAAVVGALPDLPFADDVFGAVGANFVVNHTGDPRASVRELARVCRPEGRVALTIWPERLIAVNRLWNDVMEAAGVTPPPRQALPPALDFDRTIDGLAALVARAGLLDVTVREIGVELRVRPSDLWQAAEGGIATIGEVYRARSASGRLAMRSAFDKITERMVEDGILVLPGTALLASGLAE